MVRKRDFEEMPWCNQGAGLREELASTAGHHRAGNQAASLQLVESYASERRAEGTSRRGSRSDDCRKAAPKEEQVGFRLGERYSSERRTANQIDAKIDEIIDFS